MKGYLSKSERHFLPKFYKRMHFLTINKEGIIIPDNVRDTDHLRENRDFILFDNSKDRSGESYGLVNFNYIGKFFYFISGGLSSKNIFLRSLTNFTL